jgi:hypothetical protein
LLRRSQFHNLRPKLFYFAHGLNIMDVAAPRKLTVSGSLRQSSESRWPRPW